VGSALHQRGTCGGWADIATGATSLLIQ
jgi:hypothetical protein